MAEIRVEQRTHRSPGWLWALLAIVIIAAIVWYLWSQGYIPGGSHPANTSMIGHATTLVAQAVSSARALIA